MSFRAVDNAVGGATGIFQEAGHGLLRVSGGWGNFPGPGIFMIRTILSGTVHAITFGLTGAGVSVVFFGSDSLPFLFCSCAGFIFGSIGFYRNALARATIALERFPRLMQLHLDANYPDKGFLSYRQDQLQRGPFARSWILQSMLVCSWLTAQPALDTMLEARETAITTESEVALLNAEIEGDG